MLCPACTNTILTSKMIDDVRIDSCPACEGIWLDNGELQNAKNIRLKDFHWFDVDLWKHDADFFGAPSGMHCPNCKNTDLHTIKYDHSNISIDVCEFCHGIWLDRKEFIAILKYIKNTAEQTILDAYSITLRKELDEVFVGPDNFRTELLDIMTLIDFFTYKFAVEHERLARILMNLPR
ncbi:MAG: zf-TFIIB domain-containing protein [Candidatus Pacebacteria bacterium]|nr:zf-TFIIB domain-containing protein [Candidatus Paceibacterota bacterium]